VYDEVEKVVEAGKIERAFFPETVSEKAPGSPRSPISRSKLIAKGSFYRNEDGPTSSTSSPASKSSHEKSKSPGGKSCRGDQTLPRRSALQRAYDNIVGEANEFITSVVGRKTDTTSGSKEDSPERLHTFRSILTELLLTNDGTAPETGLVEELNRMSLEEDFDTDEVHTYLDTLCQENKIMRADGMIINI
jgi:hypothetical protein